VLQPLYVTLWNEIARK